MAFYPAAGSTHGRIPSNDPAPTPRARARGYTDDVAAPSPALARALPDEAAGGDGQERARATLRELEERARGFFPLTARGALVVVASAASLWIYAFGELDLVVFALGVAGLALVSIALLLTLATAVALRRRLGAEAARRERSFRVARFLESGERIATGFALRPRRLQLATIRWSWTEPGCVASRLREEDDQVCEELLALRRGDADRLVRRFSVGDALGLTSIEWNDAAVAGLRILPHVGRLREVALLPALAAADGYAHPGGEPEGDRMEIRPYVPGDSVRDILWKAYARTGHLSVRRPERSVAPARRTVAYLVAAQGDEAAAAAARVALESDGLGRTWRFGADGSPEVRGDLGAALAAIARSGSLVENDQAAGLEAFLARAARDGDTHCFVFAPGRAGPWAERAVAAARRQPIALSFVLAVDRALPERSPLRPLWQRWLLADPPPQGVPRSDADLLVHRLEACGSAVQLVERETGAVLARRQEAPGRRPLARVGVRR